MADWFTPIWGGLTGAITEVWPEVDVIFRVSQLQRRNWQNMLENAEVALPFAIVRIPPIRREPRSGAANLVFRITPTVWYVAPEAGTDVVQTLGGKLMLLQDHLLSSDFPFEVFPDDLAIDLSETDAVNQMLLGSVKAMMAGSLTCSVLAGFTPSVDG